MTDLSERVNEVWVTPQGAVYGGGFEPLVCKCGSTKFEDHDYLEDNIVMEMDIFCTRCGEYVGHWVTGYFNPEFVFVL